MQWYTTRWLWGQMAARVLVRCWLPPLLAVVSLTGWPGWFLS
jgi:hypothetical protein